MKNLNNKITKKVFNDDRTIVIGDVHGCFNTLKKLIRKFPKDAKLIFLGDLCNRGKYSKDVIDFVMKNNYQCLLGNHELKLYRDLQYIMSKKESYEDFCYITSLESDLSIKSYKNTYKVKKVIKKHLNWIESLPLYIELKVNHKKIFLTHGFGLPYYKRRDNPANAIALHSNRFNDKRFKKDWEDFSKYKRINIFGHCVFNEVLFGKNYIGIDTGCVHGNKISAIDLNTFKVYSQKVDTKDLPLIG